MRILDKIAADALDEELANQHKKMAKAAQRLIDGEIITSIASGTTSWAKRWSARAAGMEPSKAISTFIFSWVNSFIMKVKFVSYLKTANFLQLVLDLI